MATESPATMAAVTLEEFKLWARITHDDEDAALAGMLKAATDYVQRRTHRQLVQATLTQKFDRFADPMELRSPPLQSVTKIVYLGTDAATHSVTTATYTVYTTPQPGRIGLSYLQSWPATLSMPEPITVTYVAGYGADPDFVPDGLKTAVKMLAAHWYERREAYIEAGSRRSILQEVPMAVESLIWQHAVPGAEG
jgi:uncharacterized phiE125 gp8 family phage protein